jgi:hypothetical protein
MAALARPEMIGMRLMDPVAAAARAAALALPVTAAAAVVVFTAGAAEGVAHLPAQLQ